MFYIIQNINVSYIFKSIENACQKFKRVFSISSLMMSFNLIQYRETMGMFTNCCFATNSFNYSYFSKKYHNYDTFKLPIPVIILSLNQCFLKQALLVFAIFQERSYI